MNWNRFFPSLRHRGQNLPPEPQPHPSPPLQPHPSPQQLHPSPQQLHPTAPPLLEPTAPPLVNTPVAEEQVARLMEMGFSRIDAQDALRASNNDINVATNFLLQHLG
ncbi:unnamed protein product [Oncorhynchus mykiss]|uniref:UBA domain-containing protein n=1 Tax=Oncorhynchus mykiss TaxID=8022 RepID=A0A060YVF8_ONCMY|nr:unnamed protein product [Oncorhynchus mykiss]